MNEDRIIVDGVTYAGDALISGNCYIGNSIAGDELSIDTLVVELWSSGKNLTGQPYGKPVFYYHGERLIGKFYLSDVSRTARYKCRLNCVSAVGLLDALPHYGGLYTGQSMEEVLADVIGTVVPYTVAQAAKSIRVYGWLPVATRRDNLRQLLFAGDLALKKDMAGEINIALLSANAPTEISDDRLARDGSIEYPAAVSEVVVVEHGYITTPEDKAATLYDDAVPGQDLTTPKGAHVTGALVTFDAPVYDLTATNGTILESGVNYAVLAAGGQVTLTGKKYTHTAREVSALVEGAAGERNIARVEDATLVNATNSEAVARRLAAYYSLSRTISVDMAVGDERPGDAVEFNDPFDERTTALISSLDVRMSNLLMARAGLVAGYTPVHEGVYEHVEVLTGSGEWIVPEGVHKIRVVAISGGAGGGKGGDGKRLGSGRHFSETDPSYASAQARTIQGYSHGKGGDGGEPGVPGLGGRINQVSISVNPGESIAFACGVGGASETDGGDTIFGTVTTEGCSPSAYGFVDIITGTLYAGQGDPGIAGGKGSGWDGESDPTKGEIVPGETVYDRDGNAWVPGENVTQAVSDSKSKNVNSIWYATAIATSMAAGGGGAAVGSNGKTGALGQCSVYKSSSEPTSFTISAWSGAGGSGADALPPPKQSKLGFGGHGGNGGGGCGGAPLNGGIFRWSTWDKYPDNSKVSWSIGQALTGLGGTGSAGGEGGDGCILVYY